MKSRIFLLYFLLIISFFVLIIRLFFLQIIKGSDFLTISQENRIRVEKIPAPRGIIYDRNEKALVRNIPVYVTGDKQQVTRVISKEEALRLELEGEELEMGLAREYIDGEIFASVLGYVDVEMKGRAGIEAVYNDLLTGEDGARLVETDAQGEVLHEIGEKKPVSGENIHLSIDSALQKRAWELLKGKKGAIVVSEPQAGQILALVSSPGFDPNLFSQGKVSSTPEVGPPIPSILDREGTIQDRSLAALLIDPNQPLFNRAITGLYPPGSVFKVVTAAAGLEEGKIKASTQIEDTGEIRIGAYRYGNWYFNQYGKKEGFLNIVGAIRRSNDIFFYKLGEYLGPKTLADWAEKFGYSRILGIDLLGEAEGYVADPDEKEKQTGEQWFLGDTYHLSIGQGYLMVTPLQVNVMTNVVANDGRLCQPKIAEESSLLDRRHITIPDRRHECQNLGLKQETIDLIKEGMKQACQKGGTAFPFFDFKPQVACKTGTAEFGDSQGRTHAWFTVFAPVDPPRGGPEISVTVLLEAGGEGSRDAAPIAKEILREWFKNH